MEIDVFVIKSKPFVTYKYLVQKGIPEDYVYNSTYKNSKNQWKTIYHPKKSKCKLIDYSSIQLKIINKYKLPNISELREKGTLLLHKNKVKDENEVIKYIKIILDVEYDAWKELFDFYSKRENDLDKIESFCKTHLVLVKCSVLKKDKYKVKHIYSAYNQYKDLCRRYSKITSFDNKLREILKSKELDLSLIHGLKFKQSNNFKITEDIVIEIIENLSKPNKLNGTQILDQVNDYLIKINREPISIGSVNKIIKKQEVKNKVMMSRSGEKQTEEFILPRLHFVPPIKENLLWCIDGSKFQFIYKTDKKQFNTLTYYVVLDGKSKKILGYSWDESENMEMAIRAIEMACLNTKYLPREIIADNSPAYRPKRYQQIIEKAKSWGVDWRIIKTGKSQDNAYVERFFGVFQEEICKKHLGYIGDGITSKNKNGRPAPEEIKKNLTRAKLRTKEELIELINSLIAEYNDSEKRKKAEAKNNKYGHIPRKQKIDPIPLNAIKLSLLFWKTLDKKLTHSEIVFELNKREYIYYLQNEKHALLNGKIVRIRYNENDLSRIMLFDLDKNDEYICTLNRVSRIPKLNLERTQKQINLIEKHFKNKNNIKNELKRGLEAIHQGSKINNEDVPPELTLFNPLAKETREKTENKVIEEGFEETQGVESLDDFVIPEEKNKYEEMFKNIYVEKGDLKQYIYGSN